MDFSSGSSLQILAIAFLRLSTYAKKRPTKGRFLYGDALHEYCQRALVCNCPVAYDCGNGCPKVPFMGRITSEDRGDAGD